MVAVRSGRCARSCSGLALCASLAMMVRLSALSSVTDVSITAPRTPRLSLQTCHTIFFFSLPPSLPPSILARSLGQSLIHTVAPACALSHLGVMVRLQALSSVTDVPIYCDHDPLTLITNPCPLFCPTGVRIMRKPSAILSPTAMKVVSKPLVDLLSSHVHAPKVCDVCVPVSLCPLLHTL
jgi:hypothetical protein